MLCPEVKKEKIQPNVRHSLPERLKELGVGVVKKLINNIKRMNDFEKRSEEFQKEIENLQRKYGVQVYAAQVLLQNGELATLIKMRDTMPQVATKMYDENKPKTGNSTDKKI